MASAGLRTDRLLFVWSLDGTLIRVSLFDEPSKQPLPSQPSLQDHRLALIKDGLSALPLVGGVQRRWAYF